MKTNVRTVKKVWPALFTLLLITYCVLPSENFVYGQVTPSEVIALIEDLPDNYSGLPLMNGDLQDITFAVNTSSVIKDTSAVYDGKSPVKLTSATGGATATRFGKTFASPIDLSALDNIELLLWFYDDNPESSLNDVRIDLQTDSGNYFYKYIDTSLWRKSQGASRIRYGISEFSMIGIPSMSRITGINFRMSGVEGKIESLGLFSVTYNARSKPKVILSFDDGWQDTYTNAYPILEAQGFDGVSYILSDFVQGSDPNYMRKESLDFLYASGWDIGNHSQKHENYLESPLFTAQYMENSFKNCLNYLLSCGYERSARFACYPGGSFDNELIERIKNIGIISARTTVTGLIPYLPTDFYKLKTKYIGPNTTFGVDFTNNDIKASIDKAISSGQTMVIMMHRVVQDNEMQIPGDPTNTIKTSVSMLTQVVSYLKLTDVDVCTMSQWYNDLATMPTLELSDKTVVSTARAAYESLSVEEKQFVSNYNKLIEIEIKIAQLQVDNLPKVIGMIDKLPNSDKLGIPDKPLIVETRKQYELLSNDQKPAVTNYSKLILAESTISNLEINAVINEIYLLPDTQSINIFDKSKIYMARQNCDLLNQNQKVSVTNYQKLLDLENLLLQIEQATIQKIINSISDLPNAINITLEDKTSIEQIRHLYNALDPISFALVANYSVLQAAEVTIDNLMVENVISKINLIPGYSSGISLLSANVGEINSTSNVASIIKDASVNHKGIYPIKITSATGNLISTKFGKIFSEAKDLSAINNIELLLWFYNLNPELDLNDMRIDLVTDSNNYYYKYVDTNSWTASPGACRIRYNFSDFSKIGSPDISKISKINIRMTGNPGMVESVGVFDISYNVKSNTKVILAFDDGWQDTYLNAYPILESQGFKGVTYVVSDFAQNSDPNYMRKSSLDILYNAGWDVGNHSQKHEYYKSSPTINATYMANSIKNCLNYLLSCGYDRSARFLCYPDGQFDDELITKIKDIGIISARTTVTGVIPVPPTDIYKLKTDYIGPNTTFGTVSAHDIKISIDKAIATGETLAIMMHRVSLDSEMNIPGDSTNTIKTSISLLTQVVQYLKSTGVEVCTMSQWYDELNTTRKLSTDDKPIINSARLSYDSLTDSQKALVTNYQILAQAQNKIANIENAIDVIKGYATNHNATSLTVSNLSDAGAENIFETNLDGYKTVISGIEPLSVDSTNKIQMVIDEVNTPVISIAQYITDPTNQDITVYAYTNEGILNTASHTFTENGSFEFIATNEKGYTARKNVTIYNIDKTGPKITIGYYSVLPTNQNITVTASTDEGSLNETRHIFTENGSFDFIATDAAGNITTVTVTITNIDKVAPTVNDLEDGGIYDIVIIAFSDGTATLNGLYCSNGKILRNSGNYQLIVKDIAGNETAINFIINLTPYSYTNDYIKGVSPNTKISDFSNNMNILQSETIQVFDKREILITSIDTRIATGMHVQILDGVTLICSRTIIIYGETNGDGVIDISDLATIKQHLLRSTQLAGVFKIAGDINNDGIVSLRDLLSIKKQIMGIYIINQPLSSIDELSLNTMDFKGSSLGDPSNVLSPTTGDNHNLTAAYINNTDFVQNTILIINITVNNSIVSSFSINKEFASYEEYSFNQVIYIPSTLNNEIVTVDLLLMDAQNSMKTKHDTVKNSINNVR